MQRISRQPTIQTTWSTLLAPLYWSTLLSVAGATKDAQVQNDILLSDCTRNLVVVGRQPHPDPNFASYVLPGLASCLRTLPLTAHFLDF